MGRMGVTIQFSPGESVELNDVGRSANGGKPFKGTVDSIKIDENGIWYAVLGNSGDENSMNYRIMENLSAWSLTSLEKKNNGTILDKVELIWPDLEEKGELYAVWDDGTRYGIVDVIDNTFCVGWVKMLTKESLTDMMGQYCKCFETYEDALQEFGERIKERYEVNRDESL
ncbi:hypothetical protein F373_gp032 [Bacillus phage SP-10]|uniref:hypothetical protein n=1 Tax=Bacillus phage SP10 TaxID=941058 RepID=UPI0002198AF4|nr:hypothetical protein F373_gp032 [Bacillus phage SP-10]BAK52844.1 hypothetical protein [Bacillus phage SP-10]